MQIQPARATRWQHLLADGYADVGALLRDLGLSLSDLPDGIVPDSSFPLRVPRGYVRRMRHGDPADPLLRQVLPIAAEAVHVAGFVADPVGDGAAETVPGVLHKYQGRALLVATGACAIHCRYCFRRHFPYPSSHAGAGGWRAALDYLRGDPSLGEVILSGGDPLSLGDPKLAELVGALEQIPHLRRLRIHTRLPIVLPERVDDGLLAWLGTTRLQRVVVVHANHPREIDPSVHAALWRLREHGVTVLNQSVLLAGVNDDARVLSELSESLFAAGTLPCYLHQLDRVAGAAHFEVTDERATALVRSIRGQLPGYLVPTLVREIAGEASKRPLW